jgi:hypothetical protein
LESEAAAMAQAMRDCWRFDDDHATSSGGLAPWHWQN